MRAYKKTRIYMNETPATEIARRRSRIFPTSMNNALADCIATYQQLGCWTPHVEITHAAYEKRWIFEYVGLLKRRYRYSKSVPHRRQTD